MNLRNYSSFSVLQAHRAKILAIFRVIVPMKHSWMKGKVVALVMCRN